MNHLERLYSRRYGMALPFSTVGVSTEGVALSVLFDPLNILFTYMGEIVSSTTVGIDRLSPTRFELQKDQQIDIISRKCIAGTYQFSRYVEVLKSKGRNRVPRVISIPTVRDRIVLSILKQLLHQVFPECIGKQLPNALIRQLKGTLAEQKLSEMACVRSDIQNFYDSIDHHKLLDKLAVRIQSPIALRLIEQAITTPTVPSTNRRVQHREGRNARGVPQGLAVSNILAGIYLADFDEAIEAQAVQYFRYVDDLLVVVDAGDTDSIERLIDDELHSIGLQRNQEKTVKDMADRPIEYLGYRLEPHRVSVRQASIDRYIQTVAGLFTRHLRGTAAYRARHPWLTPEVIQQVFVEDLNERITGAFDGNRQYGWLFYFQEITDMELLHKMDAIIRSFFRRLPEFAAGPPADIKRLSRTYYAIRHNREGGYIHDYNAFDTFSEKVQYLERRGRMHPNLRYTKQQVDDLFGRVKHSHLSTLDADVGLTS